MDLALVEPETTIASRAVILAGAARMKDVPARAWRLIVTSGPHAALEEILRAYAEPDWLEKVVIRRDDATRVIGLIGSENARRVYGR